MTLSLRLRGDIYILYPLTREVTGGELASAIEAIWSEAEELGISRLDAINYVAGRLGGTLGGLEEAMAIPEGTIA
jgi:hypothetical protein